MQKVPKAKKVKGQKMWALRCPEHGILGIFPHKYMAGIGNFCKELPWFTQVEVLIREIPPKGRGGK